MFIFQFLQEKKMTIVVEENVLSEDAVELDEDFQKYKQKIEPFKSGMARSPFFFLLICYS